LKSIVSKDLESIIEKKNVSKIFKTALVLVLVVFAFTMSSPSSYFQVIKPAMAAGLTSVSVVPASNIINEKSTYDFFFKTATTGTIKTIQIDFSSAFTLSNAKLVEKSGIGSGSLSISGTSLKYTVSGPVSVPSGTDIRLEIGRIVATAAGSFTVSYNDQTYGW
jgi:hypothetical protein